jgi:acetyl esterase/lipase
MAPVALLLLGLVAVALCWNAFRPWFRTPRRAVLSFFAGWLTGELALHHVAWQLPCVVMLVAAGALDAWPGWVGLALVCCAWAGFARLTWEGRTARAVVETAVHDALGEDPEGAAAAETHARLTRADWTSIASAFWFRHRDVERVRGIVYARVDGRPLKLDVHRPRRRDGLRPTLLQVHGGAWVLGRRDQQGLPLMRAMAARGWVCVSVDYRLSPRATFPDHLVDVKRALAWIRTHGPEYGCDPDFVVVTGGSAGGHLAALVALTANDPAYQPGFEGVDTSVAGCVPFYGVYDFADRDAVLPHPGLARLLERHVMKARLADARDAYDRASPIACVHPDAPPFLVIHGDRDTLVPVEQARAFCAAFRARAHGRIGYAELPGCQHAFEVFHSLRSVLAIHGTATFLERLYAEHRRALGAEPRAVAG